MHDASLGVGIEQADKRELPQGVVLNELDALESDTKTYLVHAALIDLLEFLWVFLVLPALTYVIFMKGHQTLAKLVGMGVLIVVMVYLIGVPYRRGDRARGRALLLQSRALRVNLGSEPFSPTSLIESLDRIAGSGVALESTLSALVDRLMASNARAIKVPQADVGK